MNSASYKGSQNIITHNLQKIKLLEFSSSMQLNEDIPSNEEQDMRVINVCNTYR